MKSLLLILTTVLSLNNIDSVLQQMTLEEKVSLIVGCHDAYTAKSETMTMKVPNYFLARYDVERGMWVTDKGTYQITVNSDVLTPKATISYKIAKEQTYATNYNYNK